MLCRVKELTKEAAKRSNSSLSPNVPQSFETATSDVKRSNSSASPGTHIPTAMQQSFEMVPRDTKKSNNSLSRSSHVATAGPQSFETAPDIVPRCLLRHSSTKPSLFHPSSIQFSSTPLKTPVVRKSDEDLDSLLLDGENDLPISGYHLSSGSSTNHDCRLDSIHNTSERDLAGGNKLKAEMTSSGKQMSRHDAEIVEEPPWNGLGEVQLENGRYSSAQDGVRETRIVGNSRELEMNDEVSPCSCRSLNSSQMAPHVECECSFSSGNGKLGTQLPRMQNFPPVHRLPSSSDTQQLFAETKARMESAWTNIHDFLRSEKTRTTESSYSDHLALVDRERMNTRVVHTGLERTPRRGSDCDALERVPLTTDSVTDHVDRGPCPPADDVAMETASSRHQNMSTGHCEPAGVTQENSGRSWAEILEQSRESGSRNGPCVTSAPFPDLSCSGDDVVTPEMLDTLKAKIRELKRRQEQFESDQLLVFQGRTTISTNKPLPTSSLTKPDNVLCPVSRPGTVPPLSNKTVEDTSEQSTQRTSAARNLLSEFTKSTALSENSKREILPNTSVVDVGSSSVIAGTTTTTTAAAAAAAAASAVNNCCELLPNSQPPVLSSRSNQQLEINSYMPLANTESAAVKSFTRDTLAPIADAVSASTNSNGLPLTSRYFPAVSVPLSSGYSPAVSVGQVLCKPMADLQTNILDDNTNPQSFTANTGSTNQKTASTGSANQNTGSESMRPVGVVSDDAAVVTGVYTSHPVISSSHVHLITMPAVVSSDILSLNSSSVNLLPAFQLPVTSATGSTTGPVLVGSHLENCSQVDETKTVLSSVHGVIEPLSLEASLSVDQHTVETDVAAAAAAAAGPSVNTTSAFLPVETWQGAGTEYHDDVGNFVQVSDGQTKEHDDVGNFVQVAGAFSVLRGSASDGGMIQQPVEDEATQQLRSVCKLFVYLLHSILIYDTHSVNNLLIY